MTGVQTCALPIYGVVGGEAEWLGILKVGFGFGYALELCFYWGRVGGVGVERGGKANCTVEGVGCWIVLEGNGVWGKWYEFEFEFKFDFWVWEWWWRLWDWEAKLGKKPGKASFDNVVLVLVVFVVICFDISFV